MKLSLFLLTALLAALLVALVVPEAASEPAPGRTGPRMPNHKWRKWKREATGQEDLELEEISVREKRSPAPEPGKRGHSRNRRLPNPGSMRWRRAAEQGGVEFEEVSVREKRSPAPEPGRRGHSRNRNLPNPGRMRW